jgi:two-component system, OmpR family, KDP operon response regulator KdpE
MMLPQQEPEATVVVCEDDVPTLELLCDHLEADRFRALPAPTASDALRLCHFKQPDILLLDLSLPDAPGLDVLREIRACEGVTGHYDPQLPVIVISGRGTDADRLRGFDCGADDYVVKPFGMAELLARAHAAMRRQVRASSGEPMVKAGPLSIDLAARIVTLNGQRVMMTPKEYKLLQILAQHAGNVVTHQYLLKEVWGSPHMHDTHYLRIFVRKLRQKIEEDPTQPRILLTELGIGYRLAIPETPTPTVQ